MSLITERQEALLKESWDIVKQDIPKNGLRLYQLLFEKAPDAKRTFSFLREDEENPTSNRKLKAHSAWGTQLICEAAVQLRENGKVVVKDANLGHVDAFHNKIGVTDTHYQAFKEALLKSIEEAVGDKWNDELSNAWAEAYDHLVAAIKASGAA